VTQPVRYPQQEIDLKIFKNFFNDCGVVSKNQTYLEISPVWRKVINNWTGENIFEKIENKDIKSLQKLYEHYYVNGISEGACAGKEFEDENGNLFLYYCDNYLYIVLIKNEINLYYVMILF